MAQNKPRTTLASTVCGSIIAAIAAPSAQAQRALEEVVVTAQKREENIQEVPISITRMAGDRLTARFTGNQDILALANAAPGLHIETSNGRLAPRFYMRGLGNADFTAAASQPVLFVYDDVVMEKSALKSFPLFDMEDIEILRGPQGTLFGRNTTAGIVKIDTVKPTEETEGYVKASMGTLGSYNFEGAYGGSIHEDKLMGRVSFLHQNRNNWVDNGFTGENDALGGFDVTAMRFQLLWQPTENFDALLSHQRQDQGGNSASLFRANVLSQGSNELNQNYDRDVVFYDGGDNNPARIKSHGTTLKMNLDIGAHTVTSITSWQEVYDRFARGDIDGGFGCVFTCAGPAGPPSTPFSPFTSPFVVNVDTGGSQSITQFTQEVRLASNYSGPFNYQVGGFYFKDDFRGLSGAQSAGATAFTPTSQAEIENTNWAIFGQASYDITDALKLTGGLRYTQDDKEALIEDLAAPIITPPGGANIDLDDSFLSWDVSLSYAVTDAASVYARAAAGFRAPTVQDRLEADTTLTTADSETITSYEMGFKSIWQNLRFNAAAYYYTVDDIQLTAVGGATNSTALLNADEGIGYGVELELEYLITDNLILTGGYGYTYTEINDDTLAVAPCGSGICTVLDPLDANGNALIDGNPFQHVPKWTANVELSYTQPLANGDELYFFTDWKFKGETNDFLYESIEYTFDMQFEGGMRAGYRNVANNLEIGFFARNITDEDNVIGGIDFANLLAYTNEPRVWGAEMQFRF